MEGLPFEAILKFWKRIPAKTKLIIAGAVAVLFAFLFPVICSITGNGFGNTVGVAVGTFHAVTEDMPKAYSEGKTDGLSAADTLAGVNKLREVGKLDVLAANAKITDVMKTGDKYAALYEMGADIIFSADISKAEFRYGENVVEIIIPAPEAVINFDSTKTRLLDEWQRWFGNGSSKDGIETYINSMKEIRKNAKEQIENYEYLEKRAGDSARKQVAEIAKMLVEDGTRVDVRIMETEDNGQ